MVTLPETKRKPLKIGGRKTFAFPFGFRPIFKGYVGFTEDKSSLNHHFGEFFRTLNSVMVLSNQKMLLVIIVQFFLNRWDGSD